jgi:hypothetical protein
MTVDPIPAWQQEAIDAMSARLREWLPDHKLHLVLIRAPFINPATGQELTDPAFEQLLVTDPEAARQQLLEEFEADRLAGIERDRQRAIEHQEGAKALRSLVAIKRRGRTRKAQAHSAQQRIPLD